MKTQKKYDLILISILIIIVLVITGCEQSYAPIDESLATPIIIEGDSGFPEALPSDMEAVFEAGAQTATAIAAATVTSGTGDDAAAEALEPSSESEETAAIEASFTATATNTLPVIAVATTAVPPASTIGKPASYTLQEGEFPYCIARRFDVDPGELLSLNGLSSEQSPTYETGLTLKIPQSSATFPSARAWNAHPVSYTVPQNTTVYGVACYFGDVDPAAIMSRNNIVDPNNITAGTILQIP